MNLPKKCGKMYIRFDENDNPEYGFVVEGTKIKKFVKLCDKNIDIIILPMLVESEELEMPDFDDKSKSELLRNIDKQIFQDYIVGKVKICDGCFAGIKMAKIVVPFENSIMLDWGSFDNNAEIEFVVSENLGLKQIYRMFDTGFDYEHENWTVLCDKAAVGYIGWTGFCCDTYTIDEYDETKLDHTVAKFIISNSMPKSTLCKMSEIEKQ